MTRKSAVSTFVPAVSFTGYPDGKTPVHFKAGVRSSPLPAAYIALIKQKGLAASAAKIRKESSST